MIDLLLAEGRAVKVIFETDALTLEQTLRATDVAIEAGADVYPINKLFFDTKSFSRLRMEAKLTETMEFYADGTVGVCVMPKRLLAEFSATEDDLDSISGFARSIEGVRIGVMIRWRKRSK